jgi:hypothetical protein
MPDWVPQGDAEFDGHYKKYCQIVNQKTGGAAPEWTHIPVARVKELNDGYAGWDTAFSKLSDPHTHGDILAKNNAKAEGTRIWRNFNNEFILYSSLVSERDKVDLGNKPHNPPAPSRTRLPGPSSLSKSWTSCSWPSTSGIRGAAGRPNPTGWTGR